MMLNFKLEATKELLTPHAGLAFVGEFYESLHLDSLANFYLPPPGSVKGYPPNHFVFPLVLMMIGGGEALDHTRQLTRDHCLEQMLNHLKIPDPGTIGDWLVRTYPLGYEGLNHLNRHLIDKVLSQDEHEIYTLDADATPIESHKREAKMTYKGFTGYMPMLANLAEVPLWLVDDFREGNVPPQAQALVILDRAIERMPSCKRIGFLRSDSAWYQTAIFNRCEEKDIIFAITADQDCSVKEAIARIQNWHPVRDKEGFLTNRFWGEIVHCMAHTKKAFRLIVQCWLNPRRKSPADAEYVYHVIATNSLEPAQSVITWHNGRASSENYNKEIKLGFGMEHLPCGDFGANAMYFRIGVLAYNLMVAIKYLILPKESCRQTIKTMRWLWIETAGKLIHHGRQWTLKLAQGSDELLRWWRDFRLRRDACLL
jgi:hypothetical protein